MSNHSLTTARRDGRWMTSCECGGVSDPYEHRWQADDWSADHLEQVARVRAHLRGRNPSLLDQYRWYRKQEAETTDPTERDRWAILAEGLSHRIGHSVDEVPLFEEYG
jgi:hypothetical protein